MSKSIIIYHGLCSDGFTAAWVARKALGDDAEFVPASYGDDPPDVSGKDVYILDFSYKRPVMLDLIGKAAKLVCLDHHRTAAEDLAPLCPAEGESFVDNINIIFDMSKSGAMLAWEYFFPKKIVPKLVLYVQDRDLWKWELKASRRISAVVGSYPMEWDRWDFLAADIENPVGFNSMAREGGAILRYQDRLIDSAVSHAREIVLAGHRVLAVNTTVLASEIGNRLAEGRPFGATWFATGEGKMIWSLRSTEAGIDVSEVAKQYGGGGHRNAAGFTSPIAFLSGPYAS